MATEDGCAEVAVIRPALGAAAGGPPAGWCSRSALLCECHRRLAVQSGWLELLVSARAAALPESYASRLLLLRSVSAVVCDVLLGLALFLALHRRLDGRILEGLAGLSDWAYGGALVSLVDWLMGVPADFKLNKESSRRSWAASA
ncbi:unnamed protein product [Prorocentrum cordatum]|uniref:Uncharacterized protein n=1 Tax=Prorocentrum cordatum TaxID=2364126 RepID=A0ABN9QWI2_9DINO|nr:unnamed protein product [Polarella glacialis]